MKCFSVDVCIYSIILCFSDCHDSTCAFLIVILISIYALFDSSCDFFSVCEMLDIDVRIYSTLLLLPPFCFVVVCFLVSSSFLCAVFVCLLLLSF